MSDSTLAKILLQENTERVVSNITDAYAVQARQVAAQVKDFQVVDFDTFQAASIFLRGVKGLQKEITDLFEPMTSSAHAAHKAATSKRKEFLDPVENAEAAVKDKIASWLKTQVDFTEIKADGLSISKKFKIKIVDESQIPEEYFTRVLDEKKLQALATALGDQFKVAGVEVVAEPQIAVKA